MGALSEETMPILIELKYNTINDAANELGSIATIRDTFVGFQKYLYEEKIKKLST